MIDKEKQRLNVSAKLGIALAVVMCLLIAWGVMLVRDKLLLNADEMGTSLAASYATEEENRFTVYQLFMGLGATYINDMIDQGADEERIVRWMQSFTDNTARVLGDDLIEPYAVIDGRILAAVPWEGDEGYDYADTDWYRGAFTTDNGVYFADAYEDAITGEPVITISLKLHGEGNVLAFDIRLDKFNDYESDTTMPEGSSYFLFDSNGALIYSIVARDVTSAGMQSYLEQLRADIASGALENHASSIVDESGTRRSVYYTTMDNGWLSVVTMPTQNILQTGWDETLLAIAAVFAVLLGVTAFFVIRSYRENKRAQHTADTLKILGDTFYAIYRVNYRAGTYETVKSSPDVREKLGASGDYEYMISIVKDVVENRTYQEFERSFSIENIRKLAEEDVHEYGGDYRRKFGDTFKWVSIRIIHNRDLNLDEVIMCFREIDDEKRNQLKQLELLESSLAAAKQAAERKTAFFSSVSHDMRTPLNAVIGLAKLAQDDVDDARKTADYLRKIEQAGDQLLTLVNDVLDVSRIEHGEKSALDYQPMDMRACVEDTVGLFVEQAAREDKTLVCELADEHELVYCDRKRMSQVLNNLISNALKYSLPGATVKVTTEIAGRSDKLLKYCIEVSDTGVGMSEEFLEHVFEPFARETMFAPVGVTGTGLGMPIVKNLVQQMSGEITVSSTLGEGTTFTIVVPLQIVEGEQASASDHATAEETAAGAPFTLEGRLVLVAEDNDINMLIAEEFLKQLGASVVQARNGREAVETFGLSDIGSIDAILMDMQMPEMDGCEACRAIRAMDRSDAKTVPIIAVTANAFAEDIAKTADAGMDGHVPKPLDIEALKEALQGRLR